MIRRVVTIGGPPGSGKSTTARLVAEELGLELHSAGSTFRAEAQERGLTVEAFGHYALAHPEVDRELDLAMQRRARPGVLLEGRVQGALCRRAGRPVHTVVVTAREEVRVRRVAQRDRQTVEEAAARLRDREASERDRYRRLYGIDIEHDPSDLTVDSSDRLPWDVARAVVEHVRAHDGGSAP